MKFEHTEVHGFVPAMRGMRNPLQSHHLGDSKYDLFDDYEVVGKADLTLGLKLVKAGAEHGKFMRQIQVWVDITAPRFWWQEFDQYHFHSTNSESTMHTIVRRELTHYDFDGGIDDSTLDDINSMIRYMKSKMGGDADTFMRLKRKLPESFLQKRTVNTNYAELRNIYFQRKNHRLPHWHEFCEWIRELPYSELITSYKVV